MGIFQLLKYALYALVGLPYYATIALFQLLRGDSDALEDMALIIPLYVRALTAMIYIVFMLVSGLSLVYSVYQLQSVIGLVILLILFMFAFIIIVLGYAPDTDTRHLQAAGVQYFLLFNGFWQTVVWALWSDISYHEPLSVLSLLMAATTIYLNKNVISNHDLDVKYQERLEESLGLDQLKRNQVGKNREKK